MSIDSRIFKSILAHPRLMPLFHELLGKGYRLDHLPFVLMNNKGGEGFSLHGGTVDCVSGEYNSNLAYTCHNGSIRSNLLGCNIMKLSAGFLIRQTYTRKPLFDNYRSYKIDYHFQRTHLLENFQSN